MILIKKESAWKFVTSASGGIGVSLLAAEGGAIYFNDPLGAAQTFHYGAVGAGLSWGFKIPRLPKLQIRGKSVGAVVAPPAFPCGGVLYITDGFHGDELSKSDIQGPCMFVEVGGGLAVGGYGGAMLIGLSTPAVLAAIATPLMASMIWPSVMATAKGALMFAGLNAGLQAGVFAAGFIGALL